MILRFAAVGATAGLLVAGAGAQVQVAALGANGVSLAGPSDTVGGPVLGYLHDAPTGALRPIFGVPGAAYFGPALNLGFEAKVIAVSPRQDSALAVEAGSGRLLRLTPAGSLSDTTEIVGATPNADRIFFSPSGDSAALYFRAGRQAQFVRGLRGDPQAGETVDLSAMPGVVTALAVSDDGETLLAAASSREGGEVRAFEKDGASRSVASIGRVVSMAFFHGSNDAAIADMDRNEVILARNVSSSGETSVVASEADGVRQPVAVAVSGDNGRVFAAAAEARAVATIRVSGGPVELTDCSCSPRALAPLAGDSLFRLTEDLRSAVRVFDARAQGSSVAQAGGATAEPRVLFIPALADEGAPVRDAAPPRSRGRR